MPASEMLTVWPPSQTWLRCASHLDSECIYGNGGAGTQSQCLLGFGVPNNEQAMTRRMVWFISNLMVLKGIVQPKFRFCHNFHTIEHHINTQDPSITAANSYVDAIHFIFSC